MGLTIVVNLSIEQDLIVLNLVLLWVSIFIEGFEFNAIIIIPLFDYVFSVIRFDLVKIMLSPFIHFGTLFILRIVF